jgi:hypothetical protein
MSHIKALITDTVGVTDFDRAKDETRWDPNEWQVAVHVEKPTHRISKYIGMIDTDTPQCYVDSTRPHTTPGKMAR